MRLASSTALMQFGFVALSFAALVVCYVTSDFSVATVFENSHSMMPLVYKFSSVWGNHEGSMLLWVLNSNALRHGALVAAFGGNPARDPESLCTCGAVLDRLRVLSLHSRDLESVCSIWPRVPAEGRDLNPILQDPETRHPSAAALSRLCWLLDCVFTFAIAALIEGRIDAAWARWVRPWTLAAWMFLTIGIAMGSVLGLLHARGGAVSGSGIRWRMLR